jgi:hypothetical protein
VAPTREWALTYCTAVFRFSAGPVSPTVDAGEVTNGANMNDLPDTFPQARPRNEEKPETEVRRRPIDDYRVNNAGRKGLTIDSAEDGTAVGDGNPVPP